MKKQFFARAFLCAIFIGCLYSMSFIMQDNTSTVTQGKTPPKKVLFILYKLALGGTEIASINQINQLALEGYSYEICLLDKGKDLASRLRPDVPIISWYEARHRKYDVVVSTAAWPPIWSGRVHCKKKVQWVHVDVKSAPEGWVPKPKAAWDKIDQFVCVSDGAVESFKEKFPQYASKVKRVCNIVDPALVRNMAEEPINDVTFSPKTFTIFSLGRWSPEKACERAIEAHAILDKEGFDIRWYLIGWGNDKNYIKYLNQLVEQHHLNGKFIFLGKRLNPYPYLKRADLFVSTSKTESSSIVITEAQILGLPVVTTDFCAAKEKVFEGVNGFIVQHDVPAIATAIRELIQHPEKRKAFHDAAYAMDFSNAQALQDVYDVLKAD